MPTRNPAAPAFPRIANCYGAGLGRQTWDEGRSYWSRVDLFLGGSWDLHYDWDDPRWSEVLERTVANVARLRAVNPAALVLPYVDVREAPPGVAVPDHWWTRDEDGARVSTWPGMDRIRTDLPEVMRYNLDKVDREILGRDCFDGVFYDCWHVDDWLVPRTARLRGGEAVVMLNAWNLPEDGFEHLNGVLSEDELNRVAAGTVEFEDLLRRYLLWCERSRRPAVTTLVCRPRPTDDNPGRWGQLTEAEREAVLARARNADPPMMRFGLATALMGDGCFAYDCGTMCRGQWWWYREYDAALGPPSGPARRGPDGVWQRDFEGGFVVVNGTGAPAVVELPVTLRDVTSGDAADRVELQGFDGRLFEKG